MVLLSLVTGDWKMSSPVHDTIGAQLKAVRDANDTLRSPAPSPAASATAFEHPKPAAKPSRDETAKRQQEELDVTAGEGVMNIRAPHGKFSLKLTEEEHREFAAIGLRILEAQAAKYSQESARHDAELAQSQVDLEMAKAQILTEGAKADEIRANIQLKEAQAAAAKAQVRAGWISIALGITAGILTAATLVQSSKAGTLPAPNKL
jgi:hypothetical protein